MKSGPTPTITAEVVDGSLRRKVAEARAFFVEQRQRMLDRAVRQAVAMFVYGATSRALLGLWSKGDISDYAIHDIRAEFARLMAEGDGR